MSTWKTIKPYQWPKIAQFWLLPPVCVLCQNPGQPELDLCLPCQDALPRSRHCCASCALPLPPAAQHWQCGRCQQGTRIHTTVAAANYEEPVSTLITRFKYHQHLAAGRVLTALLLDALHHRYRQQPLPDLLLPVPLHATRLRERGYNQSLLIARDLGAALRIPVAHSAVLRVRATPSQQGLDARQRRRNLRGAFVLADDFVVTRYQRIAVIDDVVTTMSTVNEIARVLRRELDEPPAIHVWCLARA